MESVFQDVRCGIRVLTQGGTSGSNLPASRAARVDPWWPCATNERIMSYQGFISIEGME